MFDFLFKKKRKKKKKRKRDPEKYIISYEFYLGHDIFF